jgi:hypothetical protein
MRLGRRAGADPRHTRSLCAGEGRAPAAGALTSIRAGHDTLGAFAKACQDPYFLLNALKEIANKYVHTLVLVLDQAEEAITLPGDEDIQDAFFQFLKLFNASRLHVKLVIALRTETFGEFFDYLHFDASVITDVKQYPLKRLGRSEVKRAIELPTSNEPVEEHRPPFEVYRFAYEPGLVDRIVDDLFAADPSGGILPVMQIVCRDLYNEIRDLSGAREITKSLYERGDKVAGRIDKHLSQSLRAALSIEMTPGAKVSDEERKWRAGLSTLARHEGDGTVRTDVTSEANLLATLSDLDVAEPTERVLAYLTRPDTVILRTFSIVSPTSGSEVTFYSLGHDAIALVLYQWTLRRQEEEKLRKNELEARRRYKTVLLFSAMTIAAIILVAAAVIGFLSHENLKREVRVSQAFAERMWVTKPRVATTAAINAVIKDEQLWWGRLKPEPKTTLAKILSSLPVRKIQTSLSPGADKGLVFPLSKRILFWNSANKIETISWGDSRISKLDLAPSLGPQWGQATLVAGGGVWKRRVFASIRKSRA